ncbi:Ubiquitin carboxyl-terminal hydrolase 20 [Dirofilaria immitis]|nr:Ubiquitin carboxyl-terminal hydrolase 20 [Dirofilaria immitis]
MTRKRLKKNSKKYGAKKRIQSTTITTSSHCKTDGAAIPNYVISEPQQNVFCAEETSEPYTNIAFRPAKATIERGFSSHSDVWQPEVMDVEIDDNENCPLGLTGLTNLGNTCYMNAAIQALSNCPPFSDFFRSLDSVSSFASKILDNNEEPPILRSFRCLLQALWSEERTRYVNPQFFLTQVRHYCPQFRSLTQQDAQEFIRCLLDVLHRELRQPVFAWEYRYITRSCNIRMKEENIFGFIRSRYIPSRSSSHASDDDEQYETADSGWSSDGVRSRQSTSPIYYRSLVTEVFDGRLSSVVKCLTCHHLSETCETFQDLSLSIPTREQLEHIASFSMNLNNDDEVSLNEQNEVYGSTSNFWQWPWWLGGGLFRSLYHYFVGDSVSLNDALAAFFLPDDLCGENMYSCEKCAKLRNGVKICKIISPPEILCIHLKRFRHELSYSVKVRSRVTFPVYDLDLTPFIANPEGNKDSVLYDLVAFITHYGGNAESGHYVAYCKNEIDDNWYEFDDTVITRLEVADILSKEAYVLFYQRQSSQNMDDIRIRVRQMLEEESYKTKVPLHHYISREWLHRFSTFSNPGPITNYDFLCQHAQILPRRAEHLTDYYATISSSLWNFLYEKFGGGPASSELHYCLPCQNEFHIIKHKREIELKAFLTLERQLNRLENDVPTLTYGYYLPPNAIAKVWIDKWKAFVEENEFEPPGSIDNNIILVSSNTCDTKLHLRASQYVQLPREAWLFFQSIYGGGPELLCIPEDHPSLENLRELVAKANEKITETLESLKRRNIVEIPLSSYS